MTVNARHLVGQTVFHSHKAESGVVDGGSIMKLNEDGTVQKVTASGEVPYGLLGQNVVTTLPGMPEGYEFPGEIGLAEQRLGEPVLVYQDGGVFEVDKYQYVSATSGGMAAGDLLYAQVGGTAYDGLLVNTSTPPSGAVADNGDGSTAVPVAMVVTPLAHDDAVASKPVRLKLLI